MPYLRRHICEYHSPSKSGMHTIAWDVTENLTHFLERSDGTAIRSELTFEENPEIIIDCSSIRWKVKLKRMCINECKNEELNFKPLNLWISKKRNCSTLSKFHKCSVKCCKCFSLLKWEFIIRIDIIIINMIWLLHTWRQSK